MSVSIELSVTQNTATAKLNELGRITSDPETLLLNAAHEVKGYLQNYHEQFGNFWRGGHYMSGPHSGEFEHNVAQSWQEPVPIAINEAKIVNTNPILAHKIKGGTIRPVRATKLTIPLVPDAKGVSAAQYASTHGKLFFVKTHGPGSNAVLAMNRLDNRTGGFDLVPIYALVDSVTQSPWPGAMPPQELVQEVFDKAFEVRFAQEMAGAT